MSCRVVAPGRVNLIGEHTDYNDLPVLPMAIDRSVVIDFDIIDRPEVRLESSLPDLAPARFTLDDEMGRAPQGDWSNYLRAAAKGLLDAGIPLARGLSGTVHGTVPLAAGLSSSSALVVATSLALLHANGREMGLLELAATAARAERFVGLEGGGMDQAVCLSGRQGAAVRIDFAPLRITPVPIPDGWRWLIAHSLVQAEKSGAAREAYNRRAATCRASLAALREVWGEPDVTYPDLARRSDVVSRAEDVLDPVSLRRFRHVISEARRVDEAQAAMEASDPVRFGRLMFSSHASLRDDYEVSISQLDEMVRIAERAGALGARLTGAGFGGCMVALCDEAGISAVRDSLLEQYYATRSDHRLENGPSLTDDRIFEVRPSDGARVEG